MTADRPAVAVIGAGVIGLSVARRLAEEGCRVALFDDRPGQGATHAAAGMLAPVSESAYGEEAVLALGLESLRRWPRFAQTLEQATGLPVGLRQCGTLAVAHNADDAEELRRFAGLLERQSLDVRPMTGREARTMEPALSARTVAALDVPGDHSVDNRALTRALLAAAGSAGVVLHRERAVPVVEDGTAVGVEVTGVEARHGCDTVVLAAGADSSTLPGPPQRAVPDVRPVKGQILRLRGAGRLLTRTVRARVAGQHVYLVPRDTGELVVGATTEDVGFDTRVTAGAVHDILRAAITVVPQVSELELAEAIARLRPTARDNAPLIGPTPVRQLLMATAHYRGGLLMAPATAEAIADLVLGRQPSAAVSALSPLAQHRLRKQEIPA